MSEKQASEVQAELQEYLNSKNINNLFLLLVEALLTEKPDNPISFVIEYLQKKYPDLAAEVHVKAMREKEREERFLQLPLFSSPFFLLFLSSEKHLPSSPRKNWIQMTATQTQTTRKTMKSLNEEPRRGLQISVERESLQKSVPHCQRFFFPFFPLPFSSSFAF